MTSLRYGPRTPRKIAGAIKRNIQHRIIRWKRRKAKPPDSAINLPPLPNAAVVLGIGPANFAGQGWAWKVAVEKYLEDVVAEVFAVSGNALEFPADRVIEPWWYGSRYWQTTQQDRVLNDYTHVLAEAVRPVFGLRYGDTLAADLPLLRKVGKPVAILLHGSEIRRPDKHADRYPHSPFGVEHDEFDRVLRNQAVRLGRIVQGFLADGVGPVFVSTPDLLDDVPGATWLPVVVDQVVWHSEHLPMERARPIVVHVPSRAKMKGSDQIDPQVQALADRGLIEYRRLEGVEPHEMPALIADADIVLDQFALGSYGVSAVQAMAAGRVTVGHVVEHVRDRVGVSLPIVEANPLTIGEVLEQLVLDRELALTYARDGIAFAAQVHNGRRSAEILAPFLGCQLRVP